MSFTEMGTLVKMWAGRKLGEFHFGPILQVIARFLFSLYFCQLVLTMILFKCLAQAFYLTSWIAGWAFEMFSGLDPATLQTALSSPILTASHKFLTIKEKTEKCVRSWPYLIQG